MPTSRVSFPSSLLWFLSLAVAVTLPAASADTATHTATSILHSTNDVHVSMGILAVVAIAAGAVVAVAGYRVFRLAIFCCGFVLGGLAVASVVEYAFASKSWLTTASWVGFGVGGLLVGLFAISLYTTSVFVAGAAAGVLLAFTLQTTVAYRVYPSHPNNVLIVLAVVLGILGGCLALWLERPVIIVATSFVGAVLVMWGIGYYAGDFPNGADLKAYAHRDINEQWVYSIPHAWWAYLAGIVVVFALGMMLQFRKTSRNYDYKHVQSNAVASRQYGEAVTPQEREQPRAQNPISYV